MNAEHYGMFLNKNGNGRYSNSDAPERLIRYVTRENGNDKKDLLSWGGAGVLAYYGVESVIDQFYYAQKAHTRQGSFGRYIDHEIFSFSDEGEYAVVRNNIDTDQIARQMAQDIFDRDHCQVVYGVHAPDRNDSHLHIHFAINSVNYRTGNKRHENMTQTLERGKRFNKFVSNAISGKKHTCKFYC